MLERPVESLVLGERPVDSLERDRARTPSGGDERLRAGGCGTSPRPVEAAAVLLELRVERHGLVELAEPDERLDRVGVDRVHDHSPRPVARSIGTTGTRASFAATRFPVASSRWPSASRWCASPDRRLDRPGVLDPRGQDAPGVVRPARGAARRSPLGYHSALRSPRSCRSRWRNSCACASACARLPARTSSSVRWSRQPAVDRTRPSSTESSSSSEQHRPARPRARPV